jgi:electron transfer flavoprotein alpha subunit
MSVDGKVAVEPQGKLKKKYVSPSRVSKLRRPPPSRSERVCIFARRRDLGEHDVVVSGGRVVGKGGNVLKVARISKAAPLR